MWDSLSKAGQVVGEAFGRIADGLQGLTMPDVMSVEDAQRREAAFRAQRAVWAKHPDMMLPEDQTRQLYGPVIERLSEFTFDPKFGTPMEQMRRVALSIEAQLELWRVDGGPLSKWDQNELRIHLALNHLKEGEAFRAAHPEAA